MHETPPRPVHDLLRDYAQSRSETAFAELVRRYIDFVYSVALRRLGGDAHLAQDAAQRIFTDLARFLHDQPHLAASPTFALGGWLHRHACFVTSTMRRSEDRRKKREAYAATMKDSQPAEAASAPEVWARLQPELDGALELLQDRDREILLQRFYEQKDLRSVGVSLGISPDAAQKRVHRALERLRDLLARQGIALAAPLLLDWMSDRAVAQAPSHLASTVARQVLNTTSAARPLDLGNRPSSSAMATEAPQLAGRIALAVVGLGTAILLALHPWREMPSPQARSLASTLRKEASLEGGLSSKATPTVLMNEPGAAAPSTRTQASTLTLRFVDPESTQPLSEVPHDVTIWMDPGVDRHQITSDSEGFSTLAVPTMVSRLEIITRLPGRADTRLYWDTRRGAVIPETLTVPLEPGIPIGGTVLSPEGRPIAGAHVGFGHGDFDATQDEVFSHRFGWIETTTDLAGRWRMDRISAKMLDHLSGQAWHLDFTSSEPTVTTPQVPSAKHPALAALTSLSHTFLLKPVDAVAGRVVNAEQRPVAGALVALGSLGDRDRRETVTGADGSFVIRGALNLDTLLTAVAEGYAPSTLALGSSRPGQFLSVELSPGRTLRLRVTDTRGASIQGARIWLDTMAHRARGSTEWLRSPPIQFEFNPITDAEGVATWEHAPTRELVFDVYKPGFSRLIQSRVPANELDHTLQLEDALVIRGTITDIATGARIPRAFITVGAPVDRWPSGRPNYFWAQGRHHRIPCQAGDFELALEEPIVWGVPHGGFVLRVESEGYVPQVSRVFRPDEGTVNVPLALHRAITPSVRILDSEGQPAARARIALVEEGSRYHWVPGGIESASDSSTTCSADQDGRFELPPDEEIREVLVAHPQGYASCPPSKLRTDPIVHLRPWGSVSGTAWAAGRPAAGRTYSLTALDFLDSLTLSPDAFRATTDEEGRFRFGSVPAGHFRLQHLRDDLQATASSRQGHSMLVEVGPSAQVDVQIGDQDRAVVVRPIVPASVTDELRFVTLLTPRPMASAQLYNDSRAFHAWASRPEIRASTRAGRTIHLVRADDGTWSADQVTPGDYIVHAGAGHSATNRGRPTHILRSFITVPEGQAENTLDLGDVPLSIPGD